MKKNNQRRKRTATSEEQSLELSKKDDLMMQDESTTETIDHVANEFDRLLEQREVELENMLTYHNLMLMEELIWKWHSVDPKEIPMEPDGLFYYKETEDGEPKILTMREIKLYAVEFIKFRHYDRIVMIFKNTTTGEAYSLCCIVTDDILNERVHSGWQELFAFTVDGEVKDYLNTEFTRFYNQRWFKLQDFLY